MKIFRIFIILFALLFILTACSRSEESQQNEEPQQNEVYVQYDDSDVEEVIDTPFEEEQEPFEEEPEPLLTVEEMREEARQKLLSDFDYLVEEIYANVPLLGVIYRRTGVDLIAHFAEMRNHLSTTERFGDRAENMEQMNEAAAVYLFDYLNRQVTRRLQGLGHLRPVPRDEYLHMLVHTKRALENPDLKDLYGHMGDTFVNPSAMRFYGVDEAELNLDEDTLLLFTRTDERAINTRIYTQGEIAQITISHALNDLDYDKSVLFPFFEEIQDYPHLIIDLSNHSGGNGAHFISTVVQPLLTTSVRVHWHEFLMGGERASRAIEADMLLFDDVVEEEGTSSLGVALYYVAEYVMLHDMTEFNSQDLESLVYVLEYSGYVEPMEDGFPFSGKVWILTGPRTASAAEAAVLMAQSSGFATVVGLPTAGIMHSISEYVLLPNTGIIFRMDIGYFTDAQGRSLEEFGITPDIQVSSGQRAIDAVLELIAEGNY